MERERVFSDTPWEEKAGYCRALRVGNQIFVAGTAPADGRGGVFAPGDAYAQTRRCFDIIQAALQELGSDLDDVVRTRLYVTDMGRWEEFAQAHCELFGDAPPVNTLVQVAALADPEMLVEVEVEVLVSPSPPMLPMHRRRPVQRPVAPAQYPPMMPRELDEGCLD